MARSFKDMLNADEEPPTQKDAPTVEVPKRKRGRPKKTPAPTTEPSPTTETSPVPPKIKPAATLDELTKKVKFMGPQRLYWPTLLNLKVDDVFRARLSKVWKRFFTINQNVYKELVYEFFSTYRFNKNTHDVNSKSAMYFTLCGKTFNLSFSEFAVKMKLYTSEEVDDDSFKAGLTGWPTEETPGDFWKSFGTGDYTKNISDTHIPSPTYRILHRVVAESINQRGSSTNLVTVDDLFYMWSIVQNKPCNLAKCLAKFLYKGTGKLDTSAVCGGAYVTQLAIGLGVVTEDELNRMEVLAYTGLFEETQLRRIGVLEKDKPWRFVGTCKDSGSKGQNGTTSEATQASRPTALESQVKWSNNALHFLIQKLGYSFDPPPHMCTDGERTDGAADPASDED